MFPRDPQEPRLVAWVRNPKVRRTFILALLWTTIAVVLVSFHFVLLPFGLAVLLSFIIEPLVARVAAVRVAGKSVPRVVAVLGVYAVFLGLFAGMGNWAFAQLGREVARLGAMSANLLGEVEPLTERLLTRAVEFAEDSKIPLSRAEIEGFVRENVAAIGDQLAHNTTRILTFGRDVVGGTFRAIFGMFLVLMLTAFLSIDRDRIQRYFASLVPVEYRKAYDTVTAGIGVGLAGVVRGQVMICLTNGVLTFVGLWFLGVKLPILLATIATVFSLIPIFGSIISTIPIVAIALTDSFAKGLLALLWIIGIHLVEANLLNPKIMGDAAKIHPVVVVFALMVGEQTAGLMGALFAVPITSVVLTIFKHLHAHALELSKREGNTADLALDARTAAVAAGERPGPALTGAAPARE